MSDENQLSPEQSANVLADLLLNQERIQSEITLLRECAKLADKLAALPSHGSSLKYLGGLSDRDKYYR